MSGSVKDPAQVDLEEMIQPPSDAGSISAVVAESLKQNEKAPTVPVKKRGRPPGSGKKQPIDGPTPSPAAEIAPQTPPPPPFELPPMILKLVLGAPFEYAAAKMKREEMLLSDEEVSELAPLANACVNQYFPASAMASPHAAAFALAGSIALLALTKYQAATRAQRLENKADAKKGETPTDANPFPVTSADSLVTSGPAA